jgi:hypothetical protein
VGAALPGQRAGVADIEVLGGDRATGWFDELASTGDLPRPGGGDVLQANAPDQAIERERDHRETSAKF